MCVCVTVCVHMCVCLCVCVLHPHVSVISQSHMPAHVASVHGTHSTTPCCRCKSLPPGDTSPTPRALQRPRATLPPCEDCAQQQRRPLPQQQQQRWPWGGGEHHQRPCVQCWLYHRSACLLCLCILPCSSNSLKDVCTIYSPRCTGVKGNDSRSSNLVFYAQSTSAVISG